MRYRIRPSLAMYFKPLNHRDASIVLFGRPFLLNISQIGCIYCSFPVSRTITSVIFILYEALLPEA